MMLDTLFISLDFGTWLVRPSESSLIRKHCDLHHLRNIFKGNQPSFLCVKKKEGRAVYEYVFESNQPSSCLEDFVSPRNQSLPKLVFEQKSLG